MWHQSQSIFCKCNFTSVWLLCDTTHKIAKVLFYVWEIRKAVQSIRLCILWRLFSRTSSWFKVLRLQIKFEVYKMSKDVYYWHSFEGLILLFCGFPHRAQPDSVFEKFETVIQIMHVKTLLSHFIDLLYLLG